MGVVTQLLPSVAFQHSKGDHPIHSSDERYNYSSNSMSQDYHQQGIFSFSSNGFERSQQQIHHHQIRRDKHRVQGFEQPPSHLVALEEEPAGLPGYENPGIFSEMFNFSSGATTGTELLESQIQETCRASRQFLANGGGGGSNWYGGRQPGMMAVGGLGQSSDHSKDHNFVNEHDSVAAPHHRQISSINGESAAAMQLFLTNPQPKSSSPSPTSHPPSPTSSTLHMLLPNPSTLQGFHSTIGTPPPSPARGGGAVATFGVPSSQFTWFPDCTHEGNLHTGGQLNNPNEIGGIVEGKGLSLSLVSSLQHIDATKAEEMRMGNGGILFFNQGGGPTSPPQYQYKNLLQSGLVQNQHVHVGSGSSLDMANLLRNSKYSKAAQELLKEFCSVGRGQFKKGKFGKNNTNPNSNPSGSGDGGSSSSSKDPSTSLSAANRLEHQRRAVKLLSMLVEVDRRYNHYCEQKQMIVNSFDLVMGFAAAIPYTALAQKAMSRHFRCLKDAIASQLKQSSELLGEKNAYTYGVTKGETPRLRMLEQSLRQNRAFHQMGMMEQEAWRSQRGLPERSVNTLRAWLFEHFLHPYPSDADKHLLARQTSLSRNQVSNWFINARVRLWKPMIEEMYEQEIKDKPTTTTTTSRAREKSQHSDSARTSTPPTAAAMAVAKRSEINASESDTSLIAFNTQCLSENQTNNTTASITMSTTIVPTSTPIVAAAAQQQCLDMGSKLTRFGTIAGDVSLTLGLRHAGNLQPEKSSFSFRDFGSC